VDRKHLALISAAVLFVASGGSAFGQGSPDPRGSSGMPRRPMVGDGGFNGRFAPVDRQKFQQNARRWLQMSPDERQFLRHRSEIRRQRIQREADMALSQSGLRLDQQKRELFQNRYVEERRQLENGLRRDIEDKRRQQLPELLGRLKREFEPQQVPAATATPTATASEKEKKQP
jgi:hypothetical protein